MIDWRNIVVIDTETTGPNPFVHDLLSLAMVPLDRSRKDLKLHVSRRGGIQWNKFAKENFQNFRTTWIHDAVDVRVAYDRLEEYIAGLRMKNPIILAGHNVGFDRSFLQKLAYLVGEEFFSGISHRTLDTHSLIYDRVLRCELPSSCLTSDGAFSYFGATPTDDERHTAYGDAVATREVLEKLLVFPHV
jgi:DNA polymerase III epsilon subunit-like protein